MMQGLFVSTTSIISRTRHSERSCLFQEAPRHLLEGSASSGAPDHPNRRSDQLRGDTIWIAGLYNMSNIPQA